MSSLKKNKGAALVAVLIGILFIAILASSLLFMSTMNFKMKAMRQRASDNFYTDEFAVSELLAQIKSYSYASDTPRTDLQTLLKDGNQFNKANLNALVNSGKLPGIANINIDCIYDGTVASYEEAGNYIYLRGVKITSTNDDGYESNIVTDIKIGFPASTDAPGKLNDFSLLSDSPLYLSQSSQYFGGDIYLRQNGSLGNDALRVGSLSVVTFLGNFTFLEGDLTVENGGTIYLGGTCYVRGAINVAGTGKVVVGGTVYCRDGYTGNLVEVGNGSYEGDGGVKWANYDKYATGLGGELVSEYMHVHSGGGSTQYDKTYNQKDFRDACHNGGWNMGGAIVSGTMTIAGQSVTAKGIYLTNTDNISGGDHYEDTLIICGGSPQNFQGTITNCTFLNVSQSGYMNIAIQAGGFSWGTMDDAHFECARNLFVKGKSDWDGVEFVNNGLTMDDMTSTADADKFDLGGTKLIKYTNDADSKPFYYQEGNHTKNYFPFDNFFDRDMNKTLREFKGAAGGAADASVQPVISLINWTKD